MRRVLAEEDVAVFVETDEQWLQRITGDDFIAAVADADQAPRPSRVRLIGQAESVAALHAAVAQAVGGDPDLAIHDNEVTTAGRLELLPFLHEQSVTITAHRFGNPDPWSEDVI